MKMYSDAFLNDSYLKYVGWTMHDKVKYLLFLQVFGTDNMQQMQKFEFPASQSHILC